MDTIIVGWCIPLIAGWCMDRLLGDPRWLPHPVVGFGKLISIAEKNLNKGSARKLKGGLTALTLIALVFIISVIIEYGCYRFNVWLLFGINTVGVFFCLSGKTLSTEVEMVFDAVDKSLPDGRKQVARIVGRETGSLDAQEIRTAALETLSENLSDGSIAPLFWYALLGLPGIMTYKMINTLDSMIGYRTKRFKDFGCWAARIDDVANFIPARITAILMLISKWEIRHINFVKRYARRHASPNSGYPESALAAILDCRFGGPHCYFGEMIDKPYIGHTNKLISKADLKVALTINLRSEIIMLCLSIILSITIKYLIFL